MKRYRFDIGYIKGKPVPTAVEHENGEWGKADIAVEMYDLLNDIYNDPEYKCIGVVPDGMNHRIPEVLEKARGE